MIVLVEFYVSFLAQKMQKMTISTSIWSAQHPKAGRNTQQVTFALFNLPALLWGTYLLK